MGTVNPQLPDFGARKASTLFEPTVGSSALMSIFGLTDGALSCAGWVVLHEGSHGVVAELSGANVTEFDFIPVKLSGSGVRFASVSFEWEPGEIPSNEYALIHAAPPIAGTGLGLLGTGLWLTDLLPDNRYGKIAFAALQAGSAINGGIGEDDWATSQSPGKIQISPMVSGRFIRVQGKF